MKKFNVPTKMDYLLRVLAANYKPHLKRVGGFYQATWSREGLEFTLTYECFTQHLQLWQNMYWKGRWEISKLEGWEDLHERAKRMLEYREKHGQ